MLTGVPIHVHHPQTSSFPTPCAFTPTHLLPPPKNAPKQVTEKALCQKVQKTSHVGMHFHPKTLPQKPMKQATMYTRRHAQTTHITVQCIYRVATSFQPHPPNPYHTHTLCTPNTSQHTPPSTIITINHDTSSPSNNILIHNHYILHKTQHPTNPNYNGNTTLRKMHFAPQIPHSQARTKQTSSSQHHTYCHQYAQQTQPTSTAIQLTLFLHFTINTPTRLAHTKSHNTLTKLHNTQQRITKHY